jgi:hypothetical protein
MSIIVRRLLISALISAMVCIAVLAPQPIWAEEPYGARTYPQTAEPMPAKKHPTADEMFIDGLFLRPFMLAETLVGTAVFLITLPFSALGGNVEEAGQRLVVDPATATFRRCLGCLPDYYASRYDERE